MQVVIGDVIYIDFGNLTSTNLFFVVDNNIYEIIKRNTIYIFQQI